MRRHPGRERGALGITGILLLVYLVIGVLVAASNGYIDNLGRLKAILSLVLAVVLWPLVLLGVDLQIGSLR